MMIGNSVFAFYKNNPRNLCRFRGLFLSLPSVNRQQSYLLRRARSSPRLFQAGFFVGKRLGLRPRHAYYNNMYMTAASSQILLLFGDIHYLLTNGESSRHPYQGGCMVNRQCICNRQLNFSAAASARSFPIWKGLQRTAKNGSMPSRNLSHSSWKRA